MAGLDLTSFEFGLKETYTPDYIEDLTFNEHTLLAMTNKGSSFVGELQKISMKYANSQNGSSSFSTASGLDESLKGVAFLLLRAREYQFAKVDNETLEASEGDAGAVASAGKESFDAAFVSMAASIGRKLYRNGSGSILRLSAASGTTTTLTPADPADLIHISVGMCLEANDTDNGTSVKSSTGTEGRVASIDYDAGTFTLTTAITGLAASDYIFRRGDATAVAGTTNMTGLDGWCPYDNRSTLLAASYWNVVRTPDPYRLGGVIFDASSYSREEGLIRALSLGRRYQASYSHVFMHPDNWHELQLELGSKVVYDMFKAGSNAQIMFKGIMLSNGLPVLQDADCPKGRAWAVNLKNLSLQGLGDPMGNIFKRDGISSLRSTSSDSTVWQIYSYLNLRCNNPLNLMQIKVS